MLMPRGKEIYKRNFACHMVIGDETSLGTALSIKAETEKHDRNFASIFELDDHEVLRELKLYGSHTTKNTAHKLTEQLDTLIKEGTIDPTATAFYITGNGATLQAVRQRLKQSGVANNQIVAQTYWIAGKKGL